MNREEVIRTVKTDYFLMEDYEKVKEIIKALEEKPCIDVVSRQAVLTRLILQIRLLMKIEQSKHIKNYL